MALLSLIYCSSLHGKICTHRTCHNTVGRASRKVHMYLMRTAEETCLFAQISWLWKRNKDPKVKSRSIKQCRKFCISEVFTLLPEYMRDECMNTVLTLTHFRPYFYSKCRNGKAQSCSALQKEDHFPWGTAPLTPWQVVLFTAVRE